MHGRPGPDETPYDLRDEVIAEMNDEEPNFIIVTEDGEMIRHFPNDPEPYSGIRMDIQSGRLDVAEDDVAHIIRLGDVLWDLEEQDKVTLTRIESRNAYDKGGNHMHDGTPKVVLEYEYALFPGLHGAKSSEQKMKLDKFEKQTTSGSMHLDNYRFIERRTHRDPTSLPP